MDLTNMADRVQRSPASMDLGIIVKCYTEVGRLVGLGKIDFQAQELINLDAQSAIHSVMLNIEESGEYSKSSSCLVNYDDVDKVCVAIDKIRHMNPKSTKFKSIEAIFALNELVITVFNVPGKDAFVPVPEKMMFSVSSGGCSTYYEMNKIDELRALFVRSKEVIDSSRHG